MRSRSWMPVVLVPAAGVGVVVGMTAAAHSAPPAGGNTSPPPVVAAPAPAAPLAPTSPGTDPEESLPHPAPAHVGGGSGGRMTDANGTTVYTFSGDKPGVSTCTDVCAKTWIPVRSPGGKPQAGAGQTQSALGSMQRPDGSQQVTLNGLPLYYYAGDTAAGSAAGEGNSAFGGTWTAVAPAAAPSKTNTNAPASPTK